MNRNSWSATDAYEECVTRDQEKTMRDKLDQDLVTINNDLTQVREYRERLETQGVVVPDDPEAIRGDVIVDEATADSADKALTYKPSYVFERGYNFDWRNGSIKQGYLASIAKNQDFEAFLRSKAQAVEKFSSVSVGKNEWRMNDGTVVSDLDNSIARNKAITQNVQLLEQAWSQYYNDKVTYQVDDLTSLLRLEIDTQNVELEYSATLQGVDGNDKLLIVF